MIIVNICNQIYIKIKLFYNKMDISRSKEILDYWFPKNGKSDYNKWFLNSKNFDKEIKEKFKELLNEAEKGKGYGWLVSKDSFVAYIILMDQFSRHIYRNTKDSYKNDKGVLIFTELGIDLYKDELNLNEFMFVFMPYMHTESLQYQIKGKKIFEDYEKFVKNRILNKNLKLEDLEKYNSDIEILNNIKKHMNGHLEVIKTFGRFPKRNVFLNRKSTLQEINYLKSINVQNRSY